MEQKMMEVVLKYYREKYHLRQEDICRGICSVTTLSRLEQGEQGGRFTSWTDTAWKDWKRSHSV